MIWEIKRGIGREISSRCIRDEERIPRKMKKEYKIRRQLETRREYRYAIWVLKYIFGN